MCLAIYKPANKRLFRRYAKNGFNNNSDGAGFAIAQNGKIEIQKGFTTFKSFWKAFKDYQELPAIVHFRFATHGKTDTANCHPFSLCADTYALIHNGILNIDTSSDKDKSDTRHFVDGVLEPLLLLNDATSPAFRFLIESAIGSHNKLVLLRFDGEAVIYNEKAGNWSDGLWFSNSDYKRAKFLGFGTDNFNLKFDWRSAYGIVNHRSAKHETFPDYIPGGQNYVTDSDYWTSSAMEDKRLNISGLTDEEEIELLNQELLLEDQE